MDIVVSVVLQYLRNVAYQIYNCAFEFVKVAYKILLVSFPNTVLILRTGNEVKATMTRQHAQCT